MGSIQVDITPGNEYKLSRGGREKIRLTAQHHVMTSRQGWALHPTISEAIKDIAHPRIVDVATGTGIWMLDMAAKMPHAEFLGLDISDQQFCPSWTLPSNASFGLYDLLEEVPQELQGQFDVVHVRLLLSAGPAVDQMIFVKRFEKMLRPGGWLQWDELSWPNMMACFPSSSQDVQIVGLLDHPITQTLNKYLGLEKSLDWLNRFEKAVTETGNFDNAQYQPIPVRPYLLQMESDSCIAVITDFIDMMVSNKGIHDPTILKEMRDALAVFYADAEKGAMFSYNWVVCTARRT